MSNPNMVPEAARKGQMPTYRRLLSDNELSYFLPSRADGVNDIYIHVGFKALSTFVTPTRIALVWSIVRLRHPLLASQVQMSPGLYEEAQLSYTPPSSPSQAVVDAQASLEISDTRTADDVIDGIINGPRTLSEKRASRLFIIEHSGTVADYDMILCLTHYLGDGIAMHQIGNLFFSLLGAVDSSNASVKSEAQLWKLLEAEWARRWAVVGSEDNIIPASSETRLSRLVPKFRAAAHKIDFQKSQGRFIGGHMFPRARATSCRNIVFNATYDVVKTKAILAKCKSEGVTISNALFALCNFAWIRANRARRSATNVSTPEALPMMMYTAINIRPLLPIPPPPASFVFLAVSYFNVVLPAFLPSTSNLSAVFWHRARCVRLQKQKYLSSPMLVSRIQEMNKSRGHRAKVFAKEDDKVRGGKHGHSTLMPSAASSPANHQPRNALQAPGLAGKPSSLPALSGSPRPAPPSVALLGLSLLGNLDEVYNAESYPSIQLTRMTCGTRKGKGGMLMFSHTFRGHLFLSLGWDARGFSEGVVEDFWARVQSGVDEFLVGGRQTLHRL